MSKKEKSKNIVSFNVGHKYILYREISRSVGPQVDGQVCHVEIRSAKLADFEKFVGENTSPHAAAPPGSPLIAVASARQNTEIPGANTFPTMSAAGNLGLARTQAHPLSLRDV